MLGQALAGLPSRPLTGQLPLTGIRPESVLWTPLAVITPGPSADAARLFTVDATYGATYELTAPEDGIVEYLYPWTGFFQIGQPLVRLYDAKLLGDLTAAKAAAGQFNAQPFLVIAPPPLRAFPSPTVAAQSVRVPIAAQSQAPPQSQATLTPRRAPASDSGPQIGLQRAEAPASIQMASLQKALARAQKELAAIEEELAARKQLSQSGVLDPEEVARFEEMHRTAQAEVRKAQHDLDVAQRQGEPEQSAPLARVTVNSRRAGGSQLLQPKIPPAPMQLQYLTAPRWTDIFAPTGGLVVQPLQMPGTAVKKGAPLLRVSNSAWSRVKALTTRQLAATLEPRTPVTGSFPALGGATYVGWVLSKRYWPGDERAEVEVQITRPEDTTNADAVLFSLAYGAPQAKTRDEVQLLPSAQRVPREATLPERFLGLVPTALVTAPAQTEPVDGAAPLAGRLALAPATPHFGPATCSDPVLQARLTQLHDWQTSFIQGMTTAIYDQRLTLSYPRDGEMSKAIEKMVRGDVEHDPGYCARTLRLALGWGLGDAYQWAIQLPQHGYAARADGLPRPGDILVWPFTYGVNHSQHIGVAVAQNGSMVLLSNLSGRLGTSAILGGYVAFYKPNPEQAAATPINPVFGMPSRLAPAH